MPVPLKLQLTRTEREKNSNNKKCNVFILTEIPHVVDEPGPLLYGKLNVNETARFSIFFSKCFVV